LFDHAIVGTTQFVAVSSSIDNEGKNHTTLKPAICYFCSEPITKFEGRDTDSLLIHSIDLNHSNIAPENKVPSHYGCHSSFHHGGEKNYFFGRDQSGNKNPMYGRDRSGNKNPMFGADRSGDKNPMFGKHQTEESKRKNRDSHKKIWVNKTPEERTEHGRKTQEGMRKVKERRELEKSN